MGKWKVQAITLFAILLSLFWLACFGGTIVDFTREDATAVEPKPVQQIEKRKDEFTLVALGDSLTRGTGDDTGKGYVGMVTEELETKFDQNIIVHNLGIKGLVSAELVEQMKEKEVKRQLQAANVILITIGGNDLFQKGETISNFNEKKFVQMKQNYLQNIADICEQIRAINPTAPLFVMGLYNPFIEWDENGEMNTIVREWNHDTENKLANYQHVVFVPTSDIFQLSVNDYLYSDRFHPNQAGCRLIADRVAPLIEWEVTEDE